ncbi:MAG: phosphoribosylglycinamide synthetase C domain-containing protein [Myxococcota bacterium]|nr:phosphoribosylglycinamide synthetase C domain-containing protein [Myxococcota bacterium]
MASGGYPNEYQRGIPINGLSVVNAMTDVNVFHAGTILKDGQHVTSGGRVLAVTGLGKTPNDALERAKKAAANIEFAGQHFRKDIGQTLR